MAARVKSSRRAQARTDGGGNYFAAPKTNIEFIRTGCTPLDLALGGGWAESRVANIVGDKSTGKTLLAIEAAANYVLKWPKGHVRYREAEAAFDLRYAEALGMPVDRVDFGSSALETVEDLFEDLTKVIDGAKQPELYIVDSLDALSDRAELDRAMDEGTYGAQKAKNLSQLFRRLTRRIERSNVTLLVVSQVRSSIGQSFGRGTTRSGGRALDFYASQVIYLSQGKVETKTVRGEKRPVGLSVRAKVDKNKVSLPGREASFYIAFGYGVHDAGACLDWLKRTKLLDKVGLSNSTSEADLKKIKDEYMHDGEPPVAPDELIAAVDKYWRAIDERLLPKRRKYG